MASSNAAAAVLIGIGIKGLSDLGKLRTELDGLSNATKGLNNVLRPLGVALSVAGVLAWTKSIINSADEAGKLGQRIGDTAEAVSGLQYAARIGDVEDLTGSLDKLNRVLGQAADGSKRQTAALKAVGVSTKEIRDGTVGTVEVLLRAADAFQDMPDGIQKATLAQELFGKSGAQLIPFLNQGRDGIEALTAEAERMGLVVSGETAAAADAFNDNLTRLSGSAQGLGLSMAQELLPTLVDVTDGFVTLVGTKSESVGFFTALNEVVIILASGIMTLVATLKALLSGFATAGRMVGGFFAGGIDGLAEEARRGKDELLGIFEDLMVGVDKVGQNSVLLNALYGREAPEAPKPKPQRRTGGYDLNLKTDEQERLEARLLERSRKALADYMAFSKNYVAQLDLQIDAIGKSADETEMAAALNEIYAKATKEAADALPGEIAAIYDAADALAAQTTELIKLKQEKEKLASTGFAQFMNEMRETAINDAKLIKDALTGAFNAASDALTQFVTTGKADFKDFVRSLLADFA